MLLKDSVRDRIFTHPVRSVHTIRHPALCSYFTHISRALQFEGFLLRSPDAMRCC